MIKKENKNMVRKNRHNRMRYTIKGNAERPRLNVYRSLNNIYAQIIDDTANNGSGNTLVSASSTEKAIMAQTADMKDGSGKVVGKIIGESPTKGIKKVVSTEADTFTQARSRGCRGRERPDWNLGGGHGI